ncbi:hypothetical protein [Streptomyces sp. NPDC020983]|uniref:hypothetical protein n=1 Tax=Streptomyces sp. NPDC020983 TaxID=3365106 RepID=UPI0037A7B66C
MPEMPADPMSALAEGAAQTHEMYEAYVRAGFTEDQAMQLTIAVLTTALIK